MALPNQCPLCHSSNNHQSVITSHVYGDRGENKSAFFHCKHCDVRYQYPGLTLEEERRFYASEFEAFMASRDGGAAGWNVAEKHISGNEKMRQRRMNYLAPHLKKNPEVLEVGCSSGFMLFPLIEKGVRCTGIEPSGAFNNFLAGKGVEAYESMEQLRISKPSQKFDLIMHFFVLEHIADPLKFLESQLEILSENGKIIFEIPNAADPLYALYDIPEFERFYWSVAHPWYFSNDSLKYLLNKLNLKFEIFGDQRYDLSNHLIWARDGKPGGMERFTPVLGKEIEDAYRDSLVKSGFCDTLIGVIYKSSGK